MPKSAYKYHVVSKIIDKFIPIKLEKIFSDIQVDQVISTESIFEENKQNLLKTGNGNQMNCKGYIRVYA